MNKKTIEDGFGGEWVLCNRTGGCGLEVVRPGKVQCWCDSRFCSYCCCWEGDIEDFESLRPTDWQGNPVEILDEPHWACMEMVEAYFKEHGSDA